MMQCKCAVKDGHGVMQYHVSMAVLVLMSFPLLLLTFLNLLFGQSYLWKCLHGLVAVPVETVKFERCIHLYD